MLFMKENGSKDSLLWTDKESQEMEGGLHRASVEGGEDILVLLRYSSLHYVSQPFRESPFWHQVTVGDGPPPQVSFHYKASSPLTPPRHIFNSQYSSRLQLNELEDDSRGDRRCYSKRKVPPSGATTSGLTM